jgi:hypothetical protein
MTPGNGDDHAPQDDDDEDTDGQQARGGLPGEEVLTAVALA